MFRNTGARRFKVAGIAIAVLAVVFAGAWTAHAADQLFKNENGYTVSNNPTGGNPSFTITKVYTIESILTYHWNHGQGKPAGQIWLKNGPGQTYGPWAASVVSKYYWNVQPKIVIPPGTYTIYDSDPSTWAHNSASRNQGFAQVYGSVVDLNALPTFNEVKGRVDRIMAHDRPAAINTLSDDKKGPVQVAFGLRPKPTLSLSRNVVSISKGEDAVLRVINPVPGVPGYHITCTDPAVMSRIGGMDQTAVFHFSPYNLTNLRALGMELNKPYTFIIYQNHVGNWMDHSGPSTEIGRVTITYVP